jgi:MATE family multidrug resistance protein
MSTLGRNEAGRDLAWAGAPLRELLGLAWPIAVSWVSFSVMTLVGTLFVGRLGSAALAGVGLGGTVAFSLLCFGFGMLRGVKVLVSQAVGAGRREDHHAILAAGLGWSFVMALVTMAIGELVATLLPSIAATAASGSAAGTYVRIRLLGAPLMLAAVALRETRYGLGDSRSPMVAAVAANVVNIVSDWLLIVVLEIGVAGAAWSTILANGVELGLLVLAQRREAGWRGLRLGGVTLEDIARIWRIGSPTGIQFVLESGSFVLLAAMLASLSEVEMAAHQIAIQVIHFSFLPAFAVAEAASVLAGQAVGANRDALVPRVAHVAMWATGLYTGACALAFAFAGAVLVGPFTPEAATREVAVRLLLVASLFQVFDAANIVARGVLRGTGDVRAAALIGIGTAWAMTPPLTWLLGLRMGWGALGGWIGLCLEVIVGAVLLWARLRRGAWLQHAAESRANLAVA